MSFPAGAYVESIDYYVAEEIDAFVELGLFFAQRLRDTQFNDAVGRAVALLAIAEGVTHEQIESGEVDVKPFGDRVAKRLVVSLAVWVPPPDVSYVGRRDGKRVEGFTSMPVVTFTLMAVGKGGEGKSLASLVAGQSDKGEASCDKVRENWRLDLNAGGFSEKTSMTVKRPAERLHEVQAEGVKITHLVLPSADTVDPSRN